jgi:hypothetical protein
MVNKDQGPAPLDGLEDLLNTDDRFHGVDILRRPDGLRRVEEHLGIDDLGDGTELLALRDALRALVVGDAGAQALEAIAARHPLRLVVEHGGMRLRGDDGIAELLARVQHCVAAGTWERLGSCRNPGCGWIYYDASKNRSGRWCSTECSHVMRSRAYRARHTD